MAAFVLFVVFGVISCIVGVAYVKAAIRKKNDCLRRESCTSHGLGRQSCGLKRKHVSGSFSFPNQRDINMNQQEAFMHAANHNTMFHIMHQQAHNQHMQP